jgi:hypothetical protein
MKRGSLLFAISVVWCISVAGAMASEINRDDPWNPHHIDNLPAEVRQYITSICKGPANAQHDFATYNPHEKRWRINLEYLRCEGLGGYRRGNQCLDVDPVSRRRFCRRRLALQAR